MFLTWPYPDLGEPLGLTLVGTAILGPVGLLCGISQALSLLLQLRTLGPGHGEVGLHGAGCWKRDGDTSSQAASSVGQQH